MTYWITSVMAETSTNPGANQSTVSFYIYLNSDYNQSYYGYTGMTLAYSVGGVSGTVAVADSASCAGGATPLIASGSVTLNHNSNGALGTVSGWYTLNGAGGPAPGTLYANSSCSSTDFTVLPSTPSAPAVSRNTAGTTLTVTSATAASAVAISNYQYQYSTNNSTWSAAVSMGADRVATFGPSSPIATSATQTYYFRTQAVSSEGSSGWSASTTKLGLPAAPSAPTLSRSSGSTTVAVTSAVPSSAATITQYQVRYSTSSTFASGVSTLTLSGTSGTFAGASGSTYYVQTRAYSSAGWGSWSGSSSIYVANVPFAPGTPTASRSATGTAVTVTSTTATSDATVTNYEARYSASSTFASGVTTISLGTDRIGTFTGVATTTYYVQTRAISSEGTGPWSATATSSGITVTPPAITSVTASENVSAVNTIVGAYVKGLSKLNVAINGATASTGATISTSTITVAGQTINALSGTTGLITQSGTLTLTGTITDSSGYTATKSASLTVLDYSVPTISSVAYARATSAGVVSATGTYLRVDLSAAISSLLVSATEKNSLTIEVWSRVRGVGSYVKNVTSTPGGTTFASYVLASGFAAASSYDVQVKVIDQFNTALANSVLPTNAVTLDMGDTAVGVGKYLEKSDSSIEAAAKIYQGNGQVVNGTVVVSALADLTAWPTTYLVAGVTRGRVTDTSTNYVWSGSAWVSEPAIQLASTSQVGMVQLTDSISSTSTTTAATPSAVNAAYSYAGNAYSLAGSAYNLAATKAPTDNPSLGGVVTVNGNVTYSGKGGGGASGVAGYHLNNAGYGIFTRTAGASVYAERSTAGPVVQCYVGTAAAGTINITTSAAPTLVAPSDYRIKTDVKPIDDALETMRKIQAYTFIKTTDPTKTVTTGFIAHELAEVQPDAVFGEKDAVDENGEMILQTVGDTRLIPLMSQAIKELILKNEELEARLVKLEKSIGK